MKDKMDIKKELRKVKNIISNASDGIRNFEMVCGEEEKVHELLRDAMNRINDIIGSVGEKIYEVKKSIYKLILNKGDNYG